MVFRRHSIRMEANKDDAYHCLVLAENYMIEGDVVKAEKFINKSKKLFKTSEADELLKKLKRLKKRSNDDPAGQNAKKPKYTLPGPSRAGSLRAGTNQPKYEQAQLDAVNKILKCNDYYEVLGINKNDTTTDLNKIYRKLSQKLHPDKNPAPGATEAFQILNNAVKTLTDQEKRKLYNLVSHDYDVVNHNYDVVSHEQGSTLWSPFFILITIILGLFWLGRNQLKSK